LKKKLQLLDETLSSSISSTTQTILSLASIGEEFLKFLERYNTERDENIKQLEQIYSLIGQHTELFGTMAETINNIRNN
jgi:hypothetical protein